MTRPGLTFANCDQFQLHLVAAQNSVNSSAVLLREVAAIQLHTSTPVLQVTLDSYGYAWEHLSCREYAHYSWLYTLVGKASVRKLAIFLAGLPVL